MASRLTSLALAVACLLSGAGVALGAEALPDPTRPPAGWVGQSFTSGGPVSNSSGLQTIVLPKSGKPWAVINGERVVLGAKFGDARVVKITESEVVLKSADGLQTLKMIPGAEKSPAAGAQSKATRKE